MPQKGRVVESTGHWYKVAYNEEDGMQTINCRLPGRFRLKDHALTNPIAVGDYVDFEMNDDGSGSIEEIKDRENYLIRQSTHHQEEHQILASNIDCAYVVQSVRRPNIKQGFIDRFLVTCEAYQIPATIIFNKMDLADEHANTYVNSLTDLYESIGYPVLQTSIKTDSSLDELKKRLNNSTSVLIGPSGVGKTSILNHIDPNIDRKVGVVSDFNEKGKHTTTFAKLLPLQTGGYIVDTPGIKEFGLVNIEPWELSLFFPEMLEPRRNCKFNNCTHAHEPGCGVIEAFQEGKVDPDRYDSYLNILESLDE
ncbi:ribosome small subunit-dependent GTPase A [Fodinibius sp. Rm-B-1B1-1]|uniref:ribosome small subunit-dependent GTPase A n=1 Tax=Fodinibius alkaliphilus TaxID=3140241 RepID=UPI00315B2232